MPDKFSKPGPSRIGARTFTVDRAPLARRDLSSSADVGEHGLIGFVDSSIGPIQEATLFQKNDYSLILRSHARIYFGLIKSFVSGILALLYFGASAAFPSVRHRLIPLLGDHLPTWLLILLACTSLLWLLLWDYGIFFGARRIRFDAETGLMTYGSIWSRQSRSLTDVLAVQILSESLVTPAALKKTRPLTPDRIDRYQINLALNDPDLPRVNVADSDDQLWAQQAARELADFLRVPMIDERNV